jgi:hypothetical protein
MTPPHYERLLAMFIPERRLAKSSSQMPRLRSAEAIGCPGEFPKSSPVSPDEAAQHFIEFRRLLSVRLLKLPT